jgi:hypothetical protein
LQWDSVGAAGQRLPVNVFSMDRIEETKMEWQRCAAELQMALAVLERAMAHEDDADLLSRARGAVVMWQAKADEALQRHITQLGKN